MRNIKQITYEEWHKEGERLFGDEKWDWKFICPACGHIQSIRSILNNNPEIDKDTAIHSVYFSCEGRLNGRGKPVYSADKKLTEHPNKEDGCNWTLGGLLQIHKLEVMLNGKAHPVFEFAT